MKKNRKRKEVEVKAPGFIPEEEELLKDTTGTEALDLFAFSREISNRLSIIMVTIGFVLTMISIFSILTAIPWSLSNNLFIVCIGFLGVINTFCGLILLAKD